MNQVLSLALMGALMAAAIVVVAHGSKEEASDEGKVSFFEFEQALVEASAQNPSHDKRTIQGISSLQFDFEKLGLCQSDPCKAASKWILEMLFATNDCSSTSYYALVYVHKQLDADKRLDVLKAAAMDAFRKHGQECRSGYVTRFNSLYKDQRFLAASGRLGLLIPDELLGKVLPEDVKDGSSSPDRYRFQAIAALVEKWEASSAVWNTKSIVDTNALALKKPCEGYSELVKDIFLPARIDIISDSKYLLEVKPTRGFLEAWLKFGICEIILSDLV